MLPTSQSHILHFMILSWLLYSVQLTLCLWDQWLQLILMHVILMRRCFWILVGMSKTPMHTQICSDVTTQNECSSVGIMYGLIFNGWSLFQFIDLKCIVKRYLLIIKLTLLHINFSFHCHINFPKKIPYQVLAYSSYA